MKLKAKRPFSHKGKSYKEGEHLEVPEHEGKDLVKQGHAEEHKDKPEDESQEQGGQGGSGGQQQK